MAKFAKFRGAPSLYFSDSKFSGARVLGRLVTPVLARNEVLYDLLESPLDVLSRSSLPGVSYGVGALRSLTATRRRQVLAAASFPSVSIVMAAYNAEATIERALRALLAQTYPNIQIVVVDDASPDRTVDVVERCRALDSRICLVRRDKNGGAAKARNTGLQNAEGDYITFQDADDHSKPQRIERQLAHLLSSGALICVCNSYRVTSSGERLVVNGKRFSKAVISMLFPREPVFREIGYMVGLSVGEDSEYFQRACAAYGGGRVSHLFESLLVQEYDAKSLLFSHGEVQRHDNDLAYRQADEVRRALDESLARLDAIKRGLRSPYVGLSE